MPRRIHIGISTKTHVSHCLVPHKCPTRSPFVICSFTRETLNSASRLGHLQNPLLPLECLTLIVSPSLEHLLLLRHWHLQWQPAISEKLVAESSSPSPTPTTTTGDTKFYQRHAFPLQLQMFDRVLAVHNYWLAAPLQLQQGAKVYG
ncbi:PREDICTED: uncharacterized protein LOC104599676 isoform X2 [Nelumbo nucifera]|uniref:Uncharacterized protein LOC104599676 isoform X2 n=1 Tax=Nelumbo nucifera TaxID=4432 RepID=A0A1U8Q6T7_NELNU|nr:PREDICTED: uncharacterized protein LOC104599676 isoform X2 [Nelumbo nucifera]